MHNFKILHFCIKKNSNFGSRFINRKLYPLILQLSFITKYKIIEANERDTNPTSPKFPR